MVPGFHLSLGFTLGKAQILEWPTPLPSTLRWTVIRQRSLDTLKASLLTGAILTRWIDDRTGYGFCLHPLRRRCASGLLDPIARLSPIVFSPVSGSLPMDERMTETGRICLGRPIYRGKLTASLKLTGQQWKDHLGCRPKTLANA